MKLPKGTDNSPQNYFLAITKKKKNHHQWWGKGKKKAAGTISAKIVYFIVKGEPFQIKHYTGSQSYSQKVSSGFLISPGVLMSGNTADIFVSHRSSFGVSAPSCSLSLYWSLLIGAAISSLTLSLKRFLQQLLLCTENILQSEGLQHKGRATEHVQQYVPLPLKGHIRPRETRWKAEQLQLILKSFAVGWNWMNAFVSHFQWVLDFWAGPF